mmetsp:Transcript_26523/g.32254  ORF Transcript_26523/g.32254 Transcript_26523/m.32254 type:complete len:102 (+) Transcript_26523:82-387(+)
MSIPAALKPIINLGKNSRKQWNNKKAKAYFENIIISDYIDVQKNAKIRKINDIIAEQTPEPAMSKDSMIYDPNHPIINKLTKNNHNIGYDSERNDVINDLY